MGFLAVAVAKQEAVMFRRRVGWVWEVDWSSWVFGVEVDTDRHWSRNVRMYFVTFYFGPVLLGIDFDGKEHN